MNGMFIVVEGSDGVGTSSISKTITDWLKDQNEDVDLSCEPFGEIGKLIRSSLSGKIAMFDWRQMYHLFSADRIEHLQYIENIRKQGAHAVSDRYYPSTLVYQSVSGGLNWDVRMEAMFKEMHTTMMLTKDKIDYRLIVPDLTIFLSANTDVAFERIEKRGEEKDAFENKGFQSKVNQAYEHWFNNYGYRANTIKVDANQPYRAVLEECLGNVRKVRDRLAL